MDAVTYVEAVSELWTLRDEAYKLRRENEQLKGLVRNTVQTTDELRAEIERLRAENEQLKAIDRMWYKAAQLVRRES